MKKAPRDLLSCGVIERVIHRYGLDMWRKWEIESSQKVYMSEVEGSGVRDRPLVKGRSEWENI